MRVYQAEKIMKNHNLKLKLILLVRDPRAVRSSRLRRTWCSFPSCISLLRQCTDQLMDVVSAAKISQLYPGRVLLVKYEELVKYPVRVINIILHFLQLPAHPAMGKFIEDHMKTSNIQGNNDLHTKSLNSSAKAEEWKSHLTEQEWAKVETHCGGLVKLYANLTMF